MKEIDLGLSVLWADKDYTEVGKNFFTYEEAMKINIEGWRLPTKEEAYELLNCKYSVTKDFIKVSKRGKNGYIIFNNYITNHSYLCWTSSIYDNKGVYVVAFFQNFYPVVELSTRNSTYAVRLVKDKQK